MLGSSRMAGAGYAMREKEGARLRGVAARPK